MKSVIVITSPPIGGAGADPRFFPRGGPVGHSATKTPQASQGKVRRGVWGASPKKI